MVKKSQGARFKVFKSQEEAESFVNSHQDLSTPKRVPDVTRNSVGVYRNITQFLGSRKNMNLNFEVFLMLRYHLASVGQLVEHPPSSKQEVPGSNPGQVFEFIEIKVCSYQGSCLMSGCDTFFSNTAILNFCW